jgi:hypothetical protein
MWMTRSSEESGRMVSVLTASPPEIVLIAVCLVCMMFVDCTIFMDCFLVALCLVCTKFVDCMLFLDFVLVALCLACTIFVDCAIFASEVFGRLGLG